MLTNKFSILPVVFALFALVFSISAQTKINKRVDSTQKPIEQAAAQKQTETDSGQNQSPSGKKNSRPAGEKSSAAGKVANQNSAPVKLPAFTYEFSQPEFVISNIRIEHDEDGKGKISFRKKDFDEEVSDPVQLTDATMKKLKTHFEALSFLDSTESYQYEKDYSHLGKRKITMRKDGRERTAEFDWTLNADAKAIVDEYRKISNQYIWMFDISVARQNQPLETPRMMKSLDSYLKRDEISDPLQMVPFLKYLSDDERIPLIARNNAAKIIKDIEKKKKE